MGRTLRKAGLLLAAILVVGSIASVSAQTQPKSGLAISPPTFELSANPGDTLTNNLRVDNVIDQPLEVTVETRNFTAMGEEGGIDLSAQEGEFSLASWISVSPAKITIPARESHVFEFVTSIPANASPGGRFGSVIFKTTLKPIGGQSGVAVGQEIGALVFLKIAGEVNEKASIASFAPKHSVNESGPVGFDIRMQNEGNVQFKPQGTITISNFLGKKIASVPVNEQNVLPGAVRKMTAEWKTGWLFGKYNATVSLVYGGDKQVLTASTTFWGFPYKIVAAVLLGAVVVAALLYPRRKRIRRALKILFGKD